MTPKDKDRKDNDNSNSFTWANDQQERGYYYDDSHGYEIYQDDEDDKTDEPINDE
jgi:hypothetical protein